MGEGTPSLCRETGRRGRGRRRHGCLLIRPLHVGEVLILWNRSHSHIRRDIYFIFNSRIMGPIGEDFVDADLDLCLIYVHASSYLCLPSPSLSSSHPLHACCAGCSLSNTDAPSIHLSIPSLSLLPHSSRSPPLRTVSARSATKDMVNAIDRKLLSPRLILPLSPVSYPPSSLPPPTPSPSGGTDTTCAR